MGIETWSVFPKILDTTIANNQPLPCSDINPRLKCHETRWARDFCLAEGGCCDYKIEAHFDCLEQFYPAEKVMELRKSFKPWVLDYPTTDLSWRYRHYYNYFAMRGKQGFEGTH